MEQLRSPGGTGVRNELDHDERWQLIERILSSAPFRKAGRLRDLMRYLGELSILSQTSDLTEQRIGEALFGKAPGYSPVEDSSVRVHMRQLRLKLHEYFDSDGREEPLVVEIPKGSYALVFHAVPAHVPANAPATEPPRAEHPRNASRPLGAIVAWALVCGLTVVCGLLWTRVLSPAPVAASAPVPWPLAAVFDNTRPTEIVLADATYGIRRVMNQQSVSLEEYIKGDFNDQLPAPSVKANGEDSWLSHYTADALLTSYADVAVATSLLKLLPGRLDQTSVRSARDLHLRDFEVGNKILLGSPASNPWVLLYEKRLNFQEVRVDETRGAVKYFRNRKQMPGEPGTYAGLSRTGQNGVDYAAIALLPIDSRKGTVLIVQGLQQEGTEAAGLFLAEESGRQKLKKAMGIIRDPATPFYFEALLRIEAVGGSPSSTTIVASRVIKP
jgi:hypothetical protein